jgi:hypothetical protein
MLRRSTKLPKNPRPNPRPPRNHARPTIPKAGSSALLRRAILPAPLRSKWYEVAIHYDRWFLGQGLSYEIHSDGQGSSGENDRASGRRDRVREKRTQTPPCGAYWLCSNFRADLAGSIASASPRDCAESNQELRPSPPNGPAATIRLVRVSSRSRGCAASRMNTVASPQGWISWSVELLRCQQGR